MEISINIEDWMDKSWQKEEPSEQLTIELDDDLVDQTQTDVENKEVDPDFDGPHIIAIVIVSGCKIICSKDRRAFRFFKKNSMKKTLGLI